MKRFLALFLGVFIGVSCLAGSAMAAGGGTGASVISTGSLSLVTDSEDYMQTEGSKLYFDVDRVNNIDMQTRMDIILQAALDSVTGDVITKETADGSPAWQMRYFLEYRKGEGPYYRCPVNTMLQRIGELGVGDSLSIYDAAGKIRYRYVLTSNRITVERHIFRQFLTELADAYVRGAMSQAVLYMGTMVGSYMKLGEALERDSSGRWNPVATADFEYVADYLLHPILGKIDLTDSTFAEAFANYGVPQKSIVRLGKTGGRNNTEYCLMTCTGVRVTSFSMGQYSPDDNKIPMVLLNSLYVNEREQIEDRTSNYASIYTAITTDTELSAVYDRTYKNGTKSTTVKPNYVSSFMYPLAIPDYYAQTGATSSDVYGMMNYSTLGDKLRRPRYNYVANLLLNITSRKVYKLLEDGAYEELGDFAEMQIDPAMIMLDSTLKDTVVETSLEDNMTEEVLRTKQIGVAVCLQLMEAVIDTSGEAVTYNADGSLSINEKGGLYPTGRYVQFADTYGTAIQFNQSVGKSMQLVEGNIRTATCAVNYAFGAGSGDLADIDVTSKAYHARTTASRFRFQTALIDYYDGTQRRVGVALIRNNFYANDNSLNAWLTGSEVAGYSWVKALELSELLTSSFVGEQSVLTYEQFQKMQMVKEKLENFNSNWLYSLIRQICVILGFACTFYGVLLILAYFVDIFDILVGVDLVGKLSFGKLKACANSDYDYLKDSTEYKYVNVKQVIIRGLGCMLFGLLLVNYEIIFTAVIYAYYNIQSVAGLT